MGAGNVHLLARRLDSDSGSRWPGDSGEQFDGAPQLCLLPLVEAAQAFHKIENCRWIDLSSCASCKDHLKELIHPLPNDPTAVMNIKRQASQ